MVEGLSNHLKNKSILFGMVDVLSNAQILKESNQ